jgi:hypothetical protein
MLPAMASLAVVNGLFNWWSELTMAKQLFFGIGSLAGFVVLILALLAIVGLDSPHDFDHPDADGGGLFTVKPVIGFFLCFGWIGGWMIDVTGSVPLATLIAFVAGFIAMAAIAALLKAVYSMQSDGTLKMANVVGCIGTVYVTIPGKSASGGQVIVGMDGRTVTLGALFAGEDSLPADTKVRVTALLDPQTVQIEKL